MATINTHYIIVVHGIGEQRKNETLLPVISQFAAARHNGNKYGNLLSLGMLASVITEKHWIEFEGIPNKPKDNCKKEQWMPRVATNSKGENLRFVDFIWSDVTREQYPQVGQPLKDWSRALINRLRAREGQGLKSLDWIIYLLEIMQKGMLRAQQILNLKASSVSTKIFNDFLGDVEIYGNFPHTRGRAVRLFHEMMAKLHEDHLNEFKDKAPQYTIIAHSLGTVMTLDAITYAHANEESRLSVTITEDSKVVHFPGYDGSQFSHEHSQLERVNDLDPKKPPSVEWVNYLCSYVTLGSPIDKYLALWTDNYLHFTNTDWFDNKLITAKKNKIRHFNYSDEQDPVGFELFILQSTPVWRALMENGEDIVFDRYSYPGLAHLDYWNDYDLMHRILDVAIDNRGDPLNEGGLRGHSVQWFKIDAYLKALLISHMLIPSLGWAIATAILQMIINAIKDNSLPFVLILCFLATLYFTHYIMELLIRWRLLLILSSKEDSPLQTDKDRITADNVIRAVIYGTPILWLILLISPLMPTVRLFLDEHLKIWIVAISLAFLVSCDIALIRFTTYKHWQNLRSNIARKFSDYFLPNL